MRPGARTGAGGNWCLHPDGSSQKSSEAGALDAECSRGKAARNMELQAAQATAGQTEMLCRRAGMQ